MGMPKKGAIRELRRKPGYSAKRIEVPFQAAIRSWVIRTANYILPCDRPGEEKTETRERTNR